jgi:hypothetical protein
MNVSLLDTCPSFLLVLPRPNPPHGWLQLKAQVMLILQYIVCNEAETCTTLLDDHLVLLQRHESELTARITLEDFLSERARILALAVTRTGLIREALAMTSHGTPMSIEMLMMLTGSIKTMVQGNRCTHLEALGYLLVMLRSDEALSRFEQNQ